MDPRFRVLDEFEAARLGEGAFAAALDEVVEAGDEAAARFAAGFNPARLRDAVRAAHERLRSQGVDPPRLPDPGPPVRSVKAKGETAEVDSGRGRPGGRRLRGAGLPARLLPPPLRAAQGGALRGRLRGPRAARARAAAIARDRASGVAGALRAPDGGRVPGHERRPAGADRRAAGTPDAAVRGRRRVPVHLPLPSRRPGGVPRAPAPGEGGSADRGEAAAGELPLPPGGARGGQLRRLGAARRLHAARGRPGGRGGAGGTAARPATEPPGGGRRPSSCSPTPRTTSPASRPAGEPRGSSSSRPRRRPARHVSPRRASWPIACASWPTPVCPAATWSCCCAPSPTSTPTRRRSTEPAWLPTSSAGAATGRSSRSRTRCACSA